MKRHFVWIAALPAAALLWSVYSFRDAQAAGGETPTAVYTHGTLRLNIPYESPHAGRGRLSIEVLDPEDRALAGVDRDIEIGGGKGRWREELKLTKAIPVEDLAWHRVRYRYAYSGAKEPLVEGTESISQILRTPVIHIRAQQSYLAGGQAAVRLIVTDSGNEAIPGPGTVRIELAAPDRKPQVLFTGALNRRGTLEAQFRFPAGLVGNFPLRYAVDTPIGSTEFTQQIKLQDKVSILLTTEKPVYQPGQTIHARALALDRSRHEAAGQRKLTFELEDSRGNKVFKKATKTDRFGIASAEFGLADEVNLGMYHLRALLEGPDSGEGNTAEIALNVERYVLPKFKVAIEFESKRMEARRGYRPGDRVTGTVRANYFFGKPVDHAEITVKASSADVAVFDAGTLTGTTDREGAYRFNMQLPRYFAGRLQNKGTARVLFEATVKDNAGHSETRGEAITVSESPLLLTAVPEGGTLIPNLENQVFVLASYTDGKPAVADISVRAAGTPDQTATTDAGGVAVIRIRAGAGAQTVQLDARDREGNRATASARLEAREGDEQILLRTERAVYRAGERIHLRVFSTKTQGTAYVDVVREGQTILTRDLDIKNGQAELSITATPEMAGTLDCNAYVFGRDARVSGDHRLVFVQPADELKIEAAADSPVYKPGEEARIRFRVTNSRGEGVQAALGLQIVDESVFALAEKQPGFAKVFFYLEQEVLKPRYEIHTIGMTDVVEPVESAQAEQRNRAARALFAATEIVRANRFETEFGRTVPETKFQEYNARYRERFQAQAIRVSEGLSRAYGQNPSGASLADRILKNATADSQDAWGNRLQVRWLGGRYYAVYSAGADKRPGTEDDLGATLEVRVRKSVGRPSSGPSRIEVTVERERGPHNGRAEITGLVIDQWGGALEGATVTARHTASGEARATKANAGGQFRLAAVAAGDYLVQVSSGAETVSRKVTVNARDRAVMNATLRMNSSGTVVAVLPQRMQIGGRADDRLFAGVAGGIPGGIGGGVMGGIVAAPARQFAPPPPPPAAKMALAKEEVRTSNSMILVDQKAAPAEPRARSYFPEALYINPEIITDSNGNASIAIRMADSITTWRMAMLASTTRGALGNGTSSLKVFQDFFVDLDLPVTLTKGDRVSIPVAVYNYSGAAGKVNLQLQTEDWFSLVDDVAAKSLAVENGRVGGSQFTLEARRIGKFKLTLSARMQGGAGRADVVIREIEVAPDGREQNIVFNGRLEDAVTHDVNFPATSIPEAGKIFVRLYPGPLSQVIEGMDSILRMPGGCFEQTSSSTYPNVLALDYMKRTKKLAPEVRAKAEGYIANGYQRLLTFEVPGGGFSWFGNPPANKILTAYGLMEFHDMSKVYDVDPKVIQRTQQWLASQQQADGSWKPDGSFINEGATNRYNSDVLRITAYIGWSLENTGYQGPAVEKARVFVESHMGAKVDAYTLAVLANFAADYGKDRALTRQAMQLLLDARTEKGEQAWWTSEETGVYSTGASASIETTGLAVQALLKWGGAGETARKALSYIASKKDAAGTWGTTQATIMALRALLLSTEKGSADVRGTLEITLNGKAMEKLTLTAENNDLLHQFVFKSIDANAANKVAIRFAGKGGLAYQVVGRYFVPWSEKPAGEPLSIDVAYDRTHLAQDDIAAATATIRNNLPKAANMVMVDLGIPPGFDLLAEDLQAYQEQTAGRKGGRLEKFSLTATQAILYFDSLAPASTVTVKYRLRAKYPIRARTFASRVYEYYDPAVNSVARPVQLEVRKR